MSLGGEERGGSWPWFQDGIWCYFVVIVIIIITIIIEQGKQALEFDGLEQKIIRLWEWNMVSSYE